MYRAGRGGSCIVQASSFFPSSAPVLRIGVVGINLASKYCIYGTGMSKEEDRTMDVRRESFSAHILGEYLQREGKISHGVYGMR